MQFVTELSNLVVENCKIKETIFCASRKGVEKALKKNPERDFGGISIRGNQNV
jgi:hypothetical protein